MRRGRALAAAAAVVLAGTLAASLPAASARGHTSKVRLVKIHYRAHNGARRAAWVLLPSWYGPRRHPSIPLVISPHGRGLSGRTNIRIWGRLPARGGFAVVSPDGQGRLLERYSWGAWGQVEDLARMPEIVRRALPWLHVDHARIYAFGGSMGGQETLLLLARHPQLLAGAAAFDSVVDFARQYQAFPRLRCTRRCLQTWDGPIGRSLQALARSETGGSPRTARYAFRLRSPITYARTIAASCVPLQLWWSNSDLVVRRQSTQSRRLFDAIRRANPDAPVQAFTGHWIHTAEMHASSRLPVALSTFGLLPDVQRPFALHVVPPPETSEWCGVS